MEKSAEKRERERQRERERERERERGSGSGAAPFVILSVKKREETRLDERRDVVVFVFLCFCVFVFFLVVRWCHGLHYEASTLEPTPPQQFPWNISSESVTI